MANINPMALMLFIVGIVFVVSAVRFIRKRGRLLRSGVPAQAVVTGVREQVSSTTTNAAGHSRSNMDYIHQLAYTANGESHSGTVKEYAARKLGDVVDIVYNPDNPKDMLLAKSVEGSAKKNAFIYLFVVIGVGLIIAAAIVQFVT